MDATSRTALLRRAMAGIVLAICAPAPVMAQAPGDPPRVSLGVSVGPAILFHGDFDFTPVAWNASVRIAVSPHIMFEGAVGDWRRTETTVLQDVVVSTPAGETGRVDRIEQRSSRTQRLVQAAVLATGARGRVRWFGGGGGGLLLHLRRFRQTSSGCPSNVAVACGTFESEFSNADFGVEALGGVDVGPTPRLSITGEARLVVPVTDPGGGDLRITAGVRWSFY